MKKVWEIDVSHRLEPEVQKKIKRLLQPVLATFQPEKCLFCGTDTTWTVNNHPVCPDCHVQYEFINRERIPDRCEACGRQGEWCTEGERTHSLCYVHRDAWYHWKNPDLEYVDYRKQPERWHQVWEAGFARFIALMKEKVRE